MAGTDAPPQPAPGAVAMNTLLTLAFAAVSFFHTELKSSVPAKGAMLAKSPATVALTFTEKVNVGVSAISILKADSTEIAKLVLTRSTDGTTISGAVAKPLPTGTYIIRYHTAAEDGHAAKGAFGFSVK
jgi:methionine-rich copper-binding protein CopC